MRTQSQDPRTIVTPDAFSVDPQLLGRPLAPPGRRLIALLINLELVSVITALTSGYWFVLGVVAAAFYHDPQANEEREGRPHLKGLSALPMLHGCDHPHAHRRRFSRPPIPATE